MHDAPDFDVLPEDARAALRAYWEAVALAEPHLVALWRAKGVTLTQLRLLHILSERPLAAGDLARQAGVKASSLTRLLDRLEERGLVVRRVDDEDRRRVVVSITEAGQLLTTEQRRDVAYLRRAVLAMTGDERRQLFLGLSALLREARQCERTAAEHVGAPPAEQPHLLAAGVSTPAGAGDEGSEGR